ncbi:MAG: D-glycero-alpha-D-manno-heptose-1,7-bisphosphate 7-phosphatase [Lentimicrobium sp.]
MNLEIDKSWSLFLDRDGVINERLPDDYVKSWDQFRFANGVLEAMGVFSRNFCRIIVVTNQQGIGKGLMTEYELEEIHRRMQLSVSEAGGRIDKIYFSPFLASVNHFSRKPSVGLGLKARRDFNEISFRKSIMAGDSLSDLIFGKRLGMKTVLIGDPILGRKHPFLIDFVFPDLITFAKSIRIF